MKICIINNLYKPFQRGGAEVISEIILHGLRDLGHEVFVVTTKPYFGKETTRKNDVKVYYFRSLYYHLSKIPFFIRVFWHFFDMFDVRLYFKMKGVMRTEKPDLVITGNLKGLGFLQPLLFKKRHIKHIHILHDIQLIYPTGLLFWGNEGVLNSFPAKIYQKINKNLFSCIENIVSPSKWLLEQHGRAGFFESTKKIVLPNPIRHEVQKEAVRSEKGFTFLFVGHLTEAKGVDVLLRAYEMLKSEATQKPTRLILVGSGRLDDKNNKIVKKNDVEILGFVEHNKIKSLMASSHSLIVPSLCYENSPTVIYEAFFCGLPFVTSNLGGAKELAEEFGGQLFKPGNAEDLAKVMKNAIKKTIPRSEFKKVDDKKLKDYSVAEYIKNLLKIIR